VAERPGHVRRLGSVRRIPPVALNPRELLAASLALGRSGLVRPARPGQLTRIGWGLVSHGAGPGFGPLAGAAFSPGRPGIIDDNGPVSFGTLEQRCDAVAAGLAAVLPPGDTIGLLARNSAGAYQTMVAASRCGLDVLYLNTGFSAGQIAAVASSRGVRALVHDREFASQVPPGVISIPMSGDQALTIEAMAGRRHRDRAPAPRMRHRSRHVILTSGTTGQPKSVSRTGGNMASAIALVSGLPNRADENWLIAVPMFHAWGWLNTLLAMLLRSTIVVTGRFEPQQVLELAERERCQVLVAVPAMLRRIMDLPPGVRRRYDTSSLRAVTVSGSPLPAALAAAFMDEFGDILSSFYGTTEAGYAAVATPADLRAAPGTAGRALPLVDVRVLDDRGVPCQPGTRGMVWVGSWDTAAPGTDAARGPACTGDVGWLDDAGRLFIAGRADDMIITGGENLYPAEVEHTLEEHPSVLEAAVVGRPDPVYGQIVVAHLALRKGSSVTTAALRSWCRRRLASFQVPRRFIVHDELPRNAAGKVVKHALLDPGQG
jgi:acyl-CoA synthetase (AMP-forming)/AMP-acid ligase II